MAKDCKFSSSGTLGPPVSLAELQQMVQAGQLQGDDTVFVPAVGMWQPVRECRAALLRMTPAAAPPAAVATEEDLFEYDVAPVEEPRGAPARQMAQVPTANSRAARAEWFYTRDGQQVGPVSARQLKALAQSGGLTEEDQVWRKGMPDWAFASTIPALLPKREEQAWMEVAPPQTIQPRGYGPQGYAQPGYGRPVYGQPQMPAGYGAGARQGPTGFAVASLVLGIISLAPYVGVIPAILAIIFGAISLKNPERGGRGMARAGLIMGQIAAAFWVIYIIFVIAAAAAS